VDLKYELELLKEEGEALVSKESFTRKEYTERKITKQGNIFYLKAGKA
jgi:hypothetical protein